MTIPVAVAAANASTTSSLASRLLPAFVVSFMSTALGESLIFAGIFFMAYKMSQVLSARLFPVIYADRLSEHRRFLWDNRVVSTLHAVYVAVGAVYTLFFDEHAQLLRSSPFYTATPSAQHYLAAFAGYTICDTVLMCSRWGVRDTPSRAVAREVAANEMDAPAATVEERPWETLIHHVIALVTVSMPLRAGMYHHLSVWYLINEFSTPLLNLRYTMTDCGISKNSPIYINNLAVFILIFFWCRVVINSWILYTVVMATFYATDALWLHSRFEGGAAVALASFMLAINLYWFHYMVKIAIKFLTTDRVNKYE